MTKMQNKIKAKQDEAGCTDYYSAEECDEFYAWYESDQAGEWDCYAEYSAEECADFYGAEEGGELAQTSSKTTTKAKVATKAKMQLKLKTKEDSACTDYYSAEECDEFYAWYESYQAGEWDCYAEYSAEECADFYGAEEGGELAQTSSKATTKAKIAIKVKAAAKAKSATKAK